MSLPRIFVGTLSCGEAEFEEACQAVQQQQGVLITHHVIADQPEYFAHNMLWQAWLEQRQAHDLFVKVDADTILNRQTALSEIAELFKNPEVTGAQILLQDFFTDGLIAGLNAFSPSVQFRPSRSRLFADHADFGHRTVLKGASVASLAPIGWHCRYPHPYQAFHYGFHRALKKQHDVVVKLARAWRANPIEGRSWALAGAASVQWWSFFGADYQNKTLKNSFSRLQDEDLRCKKVMDFAARILDS